MVVRRGGGHVSLSLVAKEVSSIVSFCLSLLYCLAVPLCYTE